MEALLTAVEQKYAPFGLGGQPAESCITVVEWHREAHLKQMALKVIAAACITTNAYNHWQSQTQ